MPGSREHGQDMGSGGIWNSVQLQATHKVRIARAQAVPVLTAEVATVTFNLWVENLGPAADARIAVDVAPANFQAANRRSGSSGRCGSSPGTPG